MQSGMANRSGLGRKSQAMTRLSSRQLLKQNLTFSKPGPLDPPPIARQRALLLQKLPDPLARFLTSVLRFQERRVHIERLGSVQMLHDLGEERRGLRLTSGEGVSLGQHQFGAIGIVLRVAADNALKIRQGLRRLSQGHKAEPSPVE